MSAWFVQTTPAVENKQLNGALEFSCSLRDLYAVRRQPEEPALDGKRGAHARDHDVLYDALMRIVRDTRDIWGFVPRGLPEEEAQQRTAVFAACWPVTSSST